MSGKLFVSGDEAVALAVRQAKPHVIAAYLKTYSDRTIRMCSGPATITRCR